MHTQILEAGKVGSGAATALIYHKGQLYGGYADGSIKVYIYGAFLNMHFDGFALVEKLTNHHLLMKLIKSCI